MELVLKLFTTLIKRRCVYWLILGPTRLLQQPRRLHGSRRITVSQ